VWQWNHVPVDGQWSLTARSGYLRLHALQATDLLTARNTLTQRAVGPRSTPTAVLDLSGLRTGDVAGLALFSRPYAWIGVTRGERGAELTHMAEDGRPIVRIPIDATRVWLRAACDFLVEDAVFSYSTDGRTFHRVGEPFRMVFQLITFQGVRYALFAFNPHGAGGFADVDRLDVDEPNPRGLTKPIPYGRSVLLTTRGSQEASSLSASGHSLRVGPAPGTPFRVEDRGLGRVTLRTEQGLVSVTESGDVSLRSGTAGPSETFQWIETFTGELVLMSLSTHRYLRVDPVLGTLRADSPGPHPNGRDGVRWEWRLAGSGEP
jgi:hypothetical protein